MLQFTKQYTNKNHLIPVGTSLKRPSRQPQHCKPTLLGMGRTCRLSLANIPEHYSVTTELICTTSWFRAFYFGILQFQGNFSRARLCCRCSHHLRYTDMLALQTHLHVLATYQTNNQSKQTYIATSIEIYMNPSMCTSQKPHAYKHIYMQTYKNKQTKPNNTIWYDVNIESYSILEYSIYIYMYKFWFI